MSLAERINHVYLDLWGSLAHPPAQSKTVTGTRSGWPWLSLAKVWELPGEGIQTPLWWPVPVPYHSLSEKGPPNIQRQVPKMQFMAVNSPWVYYLALPRLFGSPLPTKPAQLPQPLLTGHATQDPEHLCSPHGALSAYPHPSWVKIGHHNPDTVSPSLNVRV